MNTSDRDKPRHETVMDVTAERIARVYGSAFVDVAGKTSDEAGLVAELEALVTEVLDRLPQLDQAMRSALVSKEDKVRLIDRAFGNRASPQVVNFLKVLAHHGRLELVRSISRIVKRLHAERSGVTEVEVRVATPLDDALRLEIESRLQKALQKQPLLRVSIDPSLIAGIWIRVGDRVFDGSIRTQLEHARRHMIDRATERIETTPERFFQTA